MNDAPCLSRNQRKIITYTMRKHSEQSFGWVRLHSRNFTGRTLKKDRKRLIDLGLLECGTSYKVGHYPLAYRLTPLGIEVARTLPPNEFTERTKVFNVVRVSVPQAAIRAAEALVLRVEPRATKAAQAKAQQKAENYSKSVLSKLNEIAALGFVAESKKHAQCRSFSLVSSLPDEVILELQINKKCVEIADIGASYGLGLYCWAKAGLGDCEEVQRLGEWLNDGLFWDRTVGKANKGTLWALLFDWQHRVTYDNYREVLGLFETALPQIVDWLDGELSSNDRAFLNAAMKIEAKIRNKIYALAGARGLDLLNKHDAFVYIADDSEEFSQILHSAIESVVGLRGHVRKSGGRVAA